MKIAINKVQSTDGVALSAFRYTPQSVATSIDPQLQTNLLFSHANGFHGRCFDPVIEDLVTDYNCTSFDYRGHGDSSFPEDLQVHWSQYGQDAISVAKTLNTKIIAIGHSMGGAALVMAALQMPELFRALIIYEPIIFPVEVQKSASTRNGPSPLVEGARRRRKTFASREEAFANYASKPPMNVFDPRALNAYVDHGFRDSNDSITLKCSPEHEARNFEMGADHDTSSQLKNLQVPTWVVSGAQQPAQPSGLAAQIANQIPNAKFIEWSDLGHFGPMQQPSRLAKLIREVDDLT